MKSKLTVILAGAAALAAVIGFFVWLHATSATTLYSKGRYAMLTGRYDEAEDYMQRIVDKDGAWHGDAYYALSQCRSHAGDSVMAVEYLRLAAVDGQREAMGAYEAYLEAHPALADAYVEYYKTKLAAAPEHCGYASKLAKMYLLDNRHVDPSAAAEVLQHFVSRAGTAERGADVAAKALAARMMMHGQGGYAASPEGALMLVQSCRRELSGEGMMAKADGDVLKILGDFELLDLAYTPEAKMRENMSRALCYYREALERAVYADKHLLRRYIQWLDDILDEASKVQHSPMWWDRKPNDWTYFFNVQTVFRYTGHTTGSGDIHYHDGYPQYPVGWGCGAWTRDHEAAVGKWGAGGKFRHIHYVERLVKPLGVARLWWV